MLKLLVTVARFESLGLFVLMQTVVYVLVISLLEVLFVEASNANNTPL